MLRKTLVTVGQKVQFDPWDGIKCIGAKELRRVVTGTVIAVYQKHHWFLAEYGIHKLRTGFKFCDIGDGVEILG